MPKDNILYALKRGTELRSSSRNILGISNGEKRVYTIQEAMGQGGFGITYLATCRIGNIPQRFAIKEFFVKDQCWRKDGDSRMEYPHALGAREEVKEWLSEFEKEGKLLNQVCKETPNIVQVNEVIHANNTAYYVMEFLEDGSLRDLVRKHGFLTEKNALSYILPVVKAVQKLHTMNLLHCDIKHANIMLRRHFNGVVEPVLIDFGESRHFNEKGNLTTTHTTAGCSQGFAPMEQYLGITTFTPQVDVYALAATLFYVLTGSELPHANDVTEEYVLKRLPDRLGDSLKKAIVHGLQKDKNLRTCDAFAFYKEVSGNETEPIRPIVSSQLPIGYILNNEGKQYKIVSVVGKKDFYIRYKATCTNNGDTSSVNTRRVQYDVYEFFDERNHRRQEDGSVITDCDINTARNHFLNLCKKITKGTISGRFYNTSDLGWVTFSFNNTYYLIDTHYRKPMHWKHMFNYGVICIGFFLLVYAGMNLYYKNIEQPKGTIATKFVKDTTITISEGPENMRVYQFTGDIVDSKGALPQGRGTAKFEDGSTYIGNLVNGICEDTTKTAVKLLSSGDKYIGTFKNGYCIEGTFVFKKDGSYYEGTFKDEDTYWGTWYNSDGSFSSKVENGTEIYDE